MSNGIGHVWAVNAEGGDEGRPNGVGPVWIENADQLGSKLPEPESSDTGKVLGVLNSDGDIGWVIDQSGTFTQVQADWDQTDSSQVSYIANKPSLATVATSGAYSDLSGTPTIPTVDQVYDASSANAQSGVAVASAVSGKQDTINDLETIRSGAAAGATAVQPAALNDYATTSALTSGLSTKQDTISDLETIRSGAAAGATAVQPGSLATVATSGSYNDLSNKPAIPSGAQLVPAATSSDADKVLTVDSLGVPGWAVIPAQPTGLFEAVYGTTTFADISQAITDKRIVYCKVDQGYNQARMAFLAYKSNVAAEFQYYRSISSHSASTQTDEVYIYKVNADGWTTTTRKAGVNVTAGTHMSQSYNDDTLTLNCTWPTVDQTYDSASTNAQSGTAVAGAISGVRQVPSTSSGDNGKVLGVTDSSGTLGWVAKGEADLFYVTYNVTTFDEIKAAHDAGKWPVLVDSNGRVAPMVDYNWAGSVSSINTAKFQVSEYDYHADNLGADYYNTVYNLELEIDESLNRTETWSTTSNNASADWNAVSGPRVIRNKPSIPTVDQTYNSASANAQSGTAVAQAIAAIPSAPTYTAGDGIAISAQNAISAKVGGGVTIGNASSTASVTDNLSVTPIRDGNVRVYPIFGRLTAETANALANGSVTIKTLVDWNNGYYTLNNYRPGIFIYNSSWGFNKYTAMMFGTNAISGSIGSIPANTEIVYDINDVNTSLSNLTIETILANPTNYVFFALPCDSSGNINWDADYGSVTSSTAAAVISTATYQSTVTVPNSIILENPLPASAVGDAGKILTVNAQGAAAWGMLGSVKSIQQVNALPANPDANTLYLIPEA